jgi:hypothetical protein
MPAFSAIVTLAVLVGVCFPDATDGASIRALPSAYGSETWKDSAIAALSTALLTVVVFACVGKKRRSGGCDCSCDGCRKHHVGNKFEITVFDSDESYAAEFLRFNAAEAKAAVQPIRNAAAAAKLSSQQASEALKNTFTDTQLLFKTEVGTGGC